MLFMLSNNKSQDPEKYIGVNMAQKQEQQLLEKNQRLR